MPPNTDRPAAACATQHSIHHCTLALIQRPLYDSALASTAGVRPAPPPMLTLASRRRPHQINCCCLPDREKYGSRLGEEGITICEERISRRVRRRAHGRRRRSRGEDGIGGGRWEASRSFFFLFYNSMGLRTRYDRTATRWPLHTFVHNALPT